MKFLGWFRRTVKQPAVDAAKLAKARSRMQRVLLGYRMELEATDPSSRLHIVRVPEDGPVEAGRVGDAGELFTHDVEGERIEAA